MNIQLYISIFCLVFCFVFFFYIKWYIKHKISDSEILAKSRIEVYRLNAEINAVTERNITLIEDRIKTLKEILEDTDKRVKVYVQELDRSRTGEALYSSLGKGIRAALKTSPEIPHEAVHRSAPVQELSSQTPKLSLVRQERAETNVSAPAPSAMKPPSKKQIRSQIDELIKENLSPADIASRLGISIAEVDLAMNLINGKK